MDKENSVRSESGSPAAPPSPAVSSEPAVTSVPIPLAHFTWYLIGPLFLFLVLLAIVGAGTGWATALDFAFFVGLAMTVFSRWLEQRSGQGVTMSGEPSTLQDFRSGATQSGFHIMFCQAYRDQLALFHDLYCPWQFPGVVRGRI